ncbi:hypothetical protein LV164_000385 [Aspergillus fumigatus]|nr:hypothetical protein KXX42_005252 [Aspergillus fumigatus]KAH1550092.1 hypothetical protein KXX57_000310 [Aspergillus fumigatus]KAH1983918.1 hypothetical protein KXW88_002695 [Aspergillus fumigatus]KAH2311320.1 hypothetical protein KXV47_004594 [Aspergillus fumigatus]KAH2668901.1 hypothetical protein KXV32_004677 [Aspergillus fumigatus]
MAHSNVPEGFLGNLTADQQKKLEQLWTIILTLSDALTSTTTIDPNEPQHRRNSSLARTNTTASKGSTATTPACAAQVSLHLQRLGLHAPEIKQVQHILTQITPEEIRDGLLSTAKHDHPDALLLRFLRARKWDVTKAFVMMLDAILWRMKDFHVDEEVIAKGELHALKASRDTSNAVAAKNGKDFLAQMRMGKAYVHGVDRLGRPIVVIRVQLHKPGAQSEETLNQFIIHVIESVRLLLVPPVETAAVVFDMTGFGLSNMEYPPVKFIIKCFEANYPESLGVLLIHNAPWVFSGIWRLIKGWMDPVIVSKIQFTKTIADLEKFIPRGQIIKELGGTEDWTYEYVEPDENENDRMEDTTARDALLAQRASIGDELLNTTSKWITAIKNKDEEEAAAAKTHRDALIEQLRLNYWQLDPYVRSRNYLDRTGVIKVGGKIDFYPKSQPQSDVEVAKVVEVEHVEQTQVQVVNA